ncbi:hypothetical protein [Moorena producens]
MGDILSGTFKFLTPTPDSRLPTPDFLLPTPYCHGTASITCYLH